MEFTAIVLAAGKGVRMKSSLPKVVHKAAGKPLVKHVIDAAIANEIDDIVVVVGHERKKVEEVLASEMVKYAVQEQQLGTGHALLQAQALISMDKNILVLAGDTPLLRAETIGAVMKKHEESGSAATILTCMFENPTGYGRIIRDDKQYFECIVEEKDTNDAQKLIKEINSGIYCFKAAQVFPALEKLSTSNAQGEYYLTDVFEILQAEGNKIDVLLYDANEDIYGVNDKVQLSHCEKILRLRKNEEMMRAGVTLIDPNTTYIDNEVIIGVDTVIHPFTIIAGKTVIGKECEIGPGTRINDSRIGDHVTIELSRIKEAVIDDHCTIGPYAYLRPETILHKNVKIGDFVEVKKSVIGENSKLPHLSYVGDAKVGKAANIGAGTITCNYDGKNKYVTIIEDGAFIGSNTNLIAPVTIGSNSITGAGSSISKDVPPDMLAVERAQQKNLKKRDQ